MKNIKITQLPISIQVKMIIALGIITFVSLGTTFYWMAKQQEIQIEKQVHAQAEALFDHMILTRAWISSYGGVYVEKTDQVETNPYLLTIPGLDVEVETKDGRILTLRNPAIATRELSESETDKHFSFHITSRNPLNPANTPTDWEAQALLNFENGAEEASTIDFENGIEMYRYMAPLKVTPDCLFCHRQQGYKTGDIRGGISVNVPFTEARETITSIRTQFLLAGAGATAAVLLILYISVNLLVLRPLQEMEIIAGEISQGQLKKRVPIRTQDEFGSLAKSLNHMTSELQKALESAEELVKQRTKRLEMVATLSEHLSAILDFDKLLSELVNQVKDNLGYYHAHIYLTDKSGQKLVMTEGAGIASEEMKALNYTVPLNSPHSIVGQAARSKEVVIIDDVTNLPDKLPHPLLPDSRSKIAVPILVEREVAGVLVVHESKVDALDESDADVLRSLANQVAVSLTNARLFEKTEQNLANTEKLYHISRHMMSAKNLSELVKVVVEGVNIPIISRAILLASEYNQTGEIEAMTLQASWYSGQGTPPRPLGTRYAWNMPTVVNMALTPEPLFFDDVQQDDRIEPVTMEGAKERNVRAMAILPLFSHNQQMGVLMLLGEKPYHFSHEEIRPYFSLVGQLASAVENQHLIEQIKQRAAELEEAHQFLNSIVENIPSMLFVKDASDLHFIRWNKAAERLTGYTQQTIIGQTGYSFLPLEKAAQWTERDTLVLASNQALDIADESVHLANKGERFLHTRKVPIRGSDGKPKYLLGISEDITKRKRAEVTLQQANEDLLKLNANKDKFFSIVAHDLKGPFSPLLGLSKFLARVADKSDPKEIKDISQSIHRSAKNVYTLLENLLAWSRVQSGNMPYEPHNLNLQSIAESTTILLATNATQKQITLQNNVSEGLFVYADEKMLDTVIRNLVSNALKFTPESGSITISATPKDDGQGNLMAEVAIADTGVGMTQESINKLFKIQTTHSTRGTNEEEGTGLGLIICYEMVERNEGTIWVESELGKGTTVKFTVPLANSAVATSLLELENAYQNTDTPSSTTPSILAPSPADLKTLFDLANAGDLLAIQDQASQIATVNKKYIPFTNILQKLAAQFQTDKLLAFIETYYQPQTEEETKKEH